MANPVEALVANASTKIDATRHPVDVSRHPVDESVYAAYLVQKALGEQALSTALELDLSGHWQQLNALGDSLHALHSLTELDLSRNGLTSLEGLASLRNLRHLNVYYNVVGRLFEVDRLRANPQLESLDLRLNPVTHAGRRHRMRALLAAPSLQVLDGRDVTGAERARVEMARVERADDAEDIDGLPRHDEEEDALADGPSDDDADADIDGFESDGLLRPVDEGDEAAAEAAAAAAEAAAAAAEAAAAEQDRIEEAMEAAAVYAAGADAARAVGREAALAAAEAEAAARLVATRDAIRAAAAANDSTLGPAASDHALGAAAAGVVELGFDEYDEPGAPAIAHSDPADAASAADATAAATAAAAAATNAAAAAPARGTPLPAKAKAKVTAADAMAEAMAVAWSYQEEAHEAMSAAEAMGSADALSASAAITATASGLAADWSAAVSAAEAMGASSPPLTGPHSTGRASMTHASDSPYTMLTSASALAATSIAATPPSARLTPEKHAELAECAQAAVRAAVADAFGGGVSDLLLPPASTLLLPAGAHALPPPPPVPPPSRWGSAEDALHQAGAVDIADGHVDAASASAASAASASASTALAASASTAPAALAVSAATAHASSSTTMPLLPTAAQAALAVGPSMAAAVEAAEERWAAEKVRLAYEDLLTPSLTFARLSHAFSRLRSPSLAFLRLRSPLPTFSRLRPPSPAFAHLRLGPAQVKLAHEIDELKAQGQRDAEAIRQSAELVRMRTHPPPHPVATRGHALLTTLPLVPRVTGADAAADA